MAKFIEADVIQKIATEAEWLTQTRIPYKGQIMLVSDSTGKVVNMKVGDGVNSFADLNYMFDSIQQNAQYVPITSNALPTPEADPAWGMVSGGTYTFEGADVFTVPDGHWGIANYSSGVWSLVDMGELPQVQGVDVINPTGEAIPKEKAVADYALERTTLRALPIDYEFIENDRPDIESDLIIVDGNGLYIPKPDYITEEDAENSFLDKQSPRALPVNYEFIENDRPDIEGDLIIVDENGLYIPKGSTNEITGKLKSLLTYNYFGEVDGYPVETVKDLDSFYSQWDDIMASDTAYITKTALTPSAYRSLPIYRYDFKPKNPKLKILITGCTHGWEKNTIFGFRLFMKQLTENWQGNEDLTFLRQNVHIIVVPVVSPEPFTTNPFTGSNTVRDRTAPETAPLNVTWTRVDNVVTVTIDEGTFPTNNPNVSISNYFTAVPSEQLINKVGVTIWDSSDATAIPTDVYDIKSIIDNKTITINTPTSGTASGTAKMFVKSDVNRNANTQYWANSGHSTSKVGQPQSWYGNKGTRPFSLIETTNIKQILDSNRDIAFYYDLHSGAGDYVTYISYPQNNKDNSFEILKNMVDNLYHKNIVYHTNSANSTLYLYATEQLSIVGSNPEWHSSEPAGSGAMTPTQATELHQWLGNLLTISSKINILNK